MDENLMKRVLPHSIEAEQSVIGSMLMDRDAIIAASEIVTADEFYQHQYGVMFEAMVELFNEGKPVDLVTLDFVRDIITMVPTSANVRFYANIVREKAVLRKLIKINEEIANTCYVGKEKLEDILAMTEKSVFNLLQDRGGGDFVHIITTAAGRICDKLEVAGEIQTVLAQKALEQKVMCIVPLGVLLFFKATSPEFIGRLYGNPLGVLIMTAALLLYGAAFYLGMKLEEIEV